MLPYAPVQLLLFTYDDGIRMPSFLVMTSGNTSGAPICREDKEAIQELPVCATVCFPTTGKSGSVPMIQ